MQLLLLLRALLLLRLQLLVLMVVVGQSSRQGLNSSHSRLLLLLQCGLQVVDQAQEVVITSRSWHLH
jgi:hypothetical protein